MAVIFDMGKVLKYYLHMKRKGKAERRLEEALQSFRIEEGIKKAEKIAREGNVFVVPCITGEERVVEIDGEVFVEVC